MALTPEQKDKIKAKVKELESTGINTQVAIKQAFDEIAGPTALSETIAKKSEEARKKESVKENLPKKESAQLNAEIANSRARFVNLRSDELKKLGYGEAEAIAIADREATKNYGGGLEATFDEFGERRGGSIFETIASGLNTITGGLITPPSLFTSASPPVVSTDKSEIAEAFRAQTTGPTAPFEIAAEKGKEKESTAVSPEGEKIFGSPGAQVVSWDKISESLLEQGITREQASKQISGMKAVYEKIYKDERAKGGKESDISKRALEQTFKEISNLEAASKDLIRPEDYPSFLEKKYDEPELMDIAAEAFGKQIKSGKPVPNYSAAQMIYFQKINEAEKEEARKKKETETKKVYTIQEGKDKGKVLSEAEYKNYLAGLREDSARPKIAQSNAPKTPAEIQAELDKEFEIPWYLQEDKKKAYLSDPTKFTQKSLTQETDIFGGTKESTASQLVRGALSGFNAVAGAAFPLLFTGTGETKTEIAERKRELRPKKYKDSHILYNIAENRGFFGESGEVADILDLGRYQPLGFEPEGTYSAIYRGGTLAADILDPSLDLAAAGAAGVRAGRTAGKIAAATGKLGKTGTVSPALTAAVDSFLDTSLVGLLGRKVTKTEGIRGAAIADVNASLSASQKMTKNVATNIDALEGLSDIEKSSAYAQEFAKKTKAGASSADAISALRSENAALIGKADDISKAIDDLATTGRSDVLSNKEVAKVLGAMASQDDSLKVLIKSVDDAAVSGKSKLSQYVGAIDEAQENRLKLGLLYNVAADTVLEATKGVSALDNLVALTRNVIVDKASVDQILKAAKETSFGKIVDNLANAPLEFKSVGGFAKPAIIVPNELKSKILEEVRNLVSTQRITGNVARNVQKGLDAGFITSDNLRFLIDRNIEAVAENIVKNKNIGLLRSEDISKLDVGKSLDILVPLESRSFSREVLKEWFTRTQGKYVSKPSVATVGQQRLLGEAVSKGSTMDVTLRTAMQKLMDNGPVGASFKKAYGIDPARKLTKHDALAYAIRGTSFNEDAMRKTLEFAINNLFYTKQTKQNLFDLFSGLDISKSTSIFSKEGLDKIATILNTRGSEALTPLKNLEQNPEKLWEIINGIRLEIQTLINDARPVAGGISDEAKYFSVNPKDIIAFKEGKGAAGQLPDVLPVGLYYKAEAERIQKEVLYNLLEEESFRNSFKATSVFDKQYIDYANGKLARFGRSTDGLNKNLIARRLEKRMEGGFDELGAITDSDIRHIYKQGDVLADDALVRQIRADRDVMEILNELNNGADSVAKQIMSKNDLYNKRTLEDVLDVIEQSTSGEQGRLFELLFGREAGTSVAENLSKGFQDIKKSLTDEVINNYSNETLRERAGLVTSRIFDYINDLRYTFLLNMRPRFHGANIATGSDIYFQTTGKLPNPVDILTGASLPSKQISSPLSIVLKDKAGRSYTASEIYERLLQQGGQSVYSFRGPNLASERILGVTTENKLKIPIINKEINVNGLTDWWGRFKNLPQAEDMAFRYATLAEAVRSGRSIDEATALARKAMFDAADISDWEKPLQKLLMFYGFRRNNFVNFVKNMASIKGINRIKNFIRTKDASEDIINEILSQGYIEGVTGISEKDRKKLPQYLEGKMIFGKIPGKDRDVIITSPSLATLDGFSIFAELVKGNFFELTADMANPNYKAIFGMDQGMGRIPTKIAPEHVFFLDQIPGVNPLDVINFISNSEVIPRRGTPEEGAVNGLIYPLTQESQQQRYKTIVDILSFTGLSTVANDFAKTVGRQGTAVEKLGLAASIAQFLGFLSASNAIPPEKVDYFTKLAKLSELNKAIGAMTKAEKKEQPILTPEAQKEVNELQAEKVEDRIDILTEKSTTYGQNLLAEYNALDKKLSDSYLDYYAEKYGETAADKMLEETEAKMEELEKEMYALGIEY
jgi:hypothetical protein